MSRSASSRSLADRLHNMRTLSALGRTAASFKARDARDLRPSRTAWASTRGEVGNLRTFPSTTSSLTSTSRSAAWLPSRAPNASSTWAKDDTLHDEMKKVNIVCQIMGRPKHLYSIYQKMVNKGKGFSESTTSSPCALSQSVKIATGAGRGAHAVGTRCQGDSKTISPCRSSTCTKSLHTTVISPSWQPLEVQIRTEEMHRQS